ncbi:hypothetical protein [Echinicola sp. 20G]|uniref:hypothetical protein n=1 Tax=Echinicola sp. 20G TaxID=2781961 RepID=UPI001F184271|nr:hypothetical protein [Echinicola sp. 20G]
MVFYVWVLIFSLMNSPEDLGCESMKEGEFKIIDVQDDGSKLVTFIERKGNEQIETVEEIGLKMSFEVVWLSECAYTLEWKETIRNEAGFEYPTDLVVRVDIIEIGENYYVQRSSSNLYDFTKECKVVKVSNPQFISMEKSSTDVVRHF